MAAELVETSRLWGRQNAAIDPLWAERLGGDLVKRTWSEPYWSKKRESALAHERVTLYGVPLVADRVVPLGQHAARRRPRAVRPARARAGGVARPAPVLRDQPAAARGGGRARAPGPAPRHRGRRGDALRLLRRPGPGRGRLRRPLRHLVEAGAPRRSPDLLTFDPAMLVHEGAGLDEGDFPDAWHEGPLTLPLSYHFEPGSRGRRRHHRRAARHAEHGRRGAVHLERARACATSW